MKYIKLEVIVPLNDISDVVHWLANQGLPFAYNGDDLDETTELDTANSRIKGLEADINGMLQQQAHHVWTKPTTVYDRADEWKIINYSACACGAAIGEGCITGSGQPAQRLHSFRVRTWREGQQ